MNFEPAEIELNDSNTHLANRCNPEVYTQVREEIFQFFGITDEKPAGDTLKCMVTIHLNGVLVRDDSDKVTTVFDVVVLEKIPSLTKTENQSEEKFMEILTDFFEEYTICLHRTTLDEGYMYDSFRVGETVDEVIQQLKDES